MIPIGCDAPAKVLLLTSQLHATPSGGRALLCRLNHDALRDLYGNSLVLLELSKRPLQGASSIINAFRGYIDGLNKAVIREALQMIQAESIGKVFVDGSNLGGFVRAIKQALPQVQVVTFFHNVESRFFLGSLRHTKTPRALAVLMANYLAERKAVRYSDKIICLTERDSHLLKKLYGRPATHVAPMAMQDTLPADHGMITCLPDEKFALFVGGGFYANRAGITWFVKHVVPRIHVKICIVGHGLEDLKPELEQPGRVEVVGPVDSLAEWYLKATFVIAPIFDGSGMKTKVAEALMYGKKIIGTPEAFSGYEDITDRAGWVCATADDFVAAIDRAQREILKSFDPELRAVYEERYSYPAARSCLARILRLPLKNVLLNRV